MKAVGSPAAPDSKDTQPSVVEPLDAQEQPTTPRRKQGKERVVSCPVNCSHSASLPSDVLIELKVASAQVIAFLWD